MSNYFKPNTSITYYFPLFFLLCFSGNPLFSSENYSKNLLVVYTLGFTLYTLNLIDWRINKKILQLIAVIVIFIFILSFFQRIALGFISYPGILALILKIILGLFTLLYYKNKKIDFLHAYIKIMFFLSIVSIPFFILNFFVHVGIQLTNSFLKSMFLYTSFNIPKNELRNPGMFWEPGAFAGYLILALLFIILRNKKFQLGRYKKEVFGITVGILTSLSTTGYIIFSIILLFYVLQNYRYGRIIILPTTVLIMFLAYVNLDFMQYKIEKQFIKSTELSQNDVSNTRFGSLIMDWQYIKTQPLIGNGLDMRTRYRFHPWINEDIGNGNGMSNFIAYWGIPFFLFWAFGFYKFARNISQSSFIAWVVLTIVILTLQGEQFLNFPVFLIFFIAHSRFIENENSNIPFKF